MQESKQKPKAGTVHAPRERYIDTVLLVSGRVLVSLLPLILREWVQGYVVWRVSAVGAGLYSAQMQSASLSANTV